MVKRKAPLFVCSFTGCNKGCYSRGGLKRHMHSHITRPISRHDAMPPANGMDIDGPNINFVDDVDEPAPLAHTLYHPVIDGVPPLGNFVHVV